jgi:hypothetical protein
MKTKKTESRTFTRRKAAPPHTGAEAQAHHILFASRMVNEAHREDSMWSVLGSATVLHPHSNWGCPPVEFRTILTDVCTCLLQSVD